MVVATQRYLDLARDYCLRGSEDGDTAWLDDIDRILSRMKQTDLIIFLRSLGHSPADTADMKRSIACFAMKSTARLGQLIVPAYTDQLSLNLAHSVATVALIVADLSL